jgi:hypothetical protein
VEHTEHVESPVPPSLVPGASSSDSQVSEYVDHADHADHASQPAEHADHTGSLVPPSLVPGSSSADSDSQASEYVEADRVDAETYAEPAVVPGAPRDLVELEMPGMSEERAADLGSASYVRLGAEGLVRLRARYAEVMARIAERPLEEATREELKQRAERLNPDAWVTADEVSAALEQYETVFEALRGVVGRHPRNRDRGRR